MFTRKEYATSVSGKTANGCPVRSAEPPDNMNFHFLSPCGAKLCEAFDMRRNLPEKIPGRLHFVIHSAILVSIL